jgi:hypothetical protein
MVRRITTTVRLSEGARELLELLSEHHGLNQSAMLEVLIRERAKRDKVAPEKILFRQLVANDDSDGAL